MIQVISDGEGLALERCCFCRKHTSYWTALAGALPVDSVACCRKCAEVATPGDVPSKLAWCRREDIAHGHTPMGQEPPPPVRSRRGVDRRVPKDVGKTP